MSRRKSVKLFRNDLFISDSLEEEGNEEEKQKKVLLVFHGEAFVEQDAVVTHEVTEKNPVVENLNEVFNNGVLTTEVVKSEKEVWRLRLICLRPGVQVIRWYNEPLCLIGYLTSARHELQITVVPSSEHVGIRPQLIDCIPRTPKLSRNSRTRETEKVFTFSQTVSSSVLKRQDEAISQQFFLKESSELRFFQKVFTILDRCNGSKMLWNFMRKLERNSNTSQDPNDIDWKEIRGLFSSSYVVKKQSNGYLMALLAITKQVRRGVIEKQILFPEFFELSQSAWRVFRDKEEAVATLRFSSTMDPLLKVKNAWSCLLRDFKSFEIEMSSGPAKLSRDSLYK